MRLSRLLGLCILSTSALGHPPPPEPAEEMLRNPWVVEFVFGLGPHRPGYSRINGYPTKAACEAAIRTLPPGGGGDGHCVYMEWGTNRIIGSQDPDWSGKDQWVIEFNAVDGKYRRHGDAYPSKEECEAAIPFQLRMQGGYNGHCIEFKDGHYVGSHDPAWAGK